MSDSLVLEIMYGALVGGIVAVPVVLIVNRIGAAWTIRQHRRGK